MFDCILTVCLVSTSRNLVFVFFHSKLNMFECQLFLYLRHFISFILNSYLLQIEYFLFCSHCIIQIIFISRPIFKSNISLESWKYALFNDMPHLKICPAVKEYLNGWMDFYVLHIVKKRKFLAF